MGPVDFSRYFHGSLHDHLVNLLKLALDEDGQDLTSNAIFSPADRLQAVIIAKETTLIAGLPVIPLIMDLCIAQQSGVDPDYSWKALLSEGQQAQKGDTIVRLEGAARHILRAERIILNIVSRLSGIATVTSQYVKALEGTGVRLLDTRKTMPGLRGLDKYAVTVGGGCNHRLTLGDMLMIKDNHVDAAGSIAAAVNRLRSHAPHGIPIEVECRNLDDVSQAVACGVERIMLDNMQPSLLPKALELVPKNIEAEISGNVTLATIRDLALCSKRRPDFISVGRITHSVSVADLSMRIAR